MRNLTIELNWELGNYELTHGKYITDHNIKINEEITLIGGSAPEYGGNKNNLNPEQALAAAVSSCMMMTFLALAAKLKWPVIKYSDKAFAFLGKNSKNKTFVNKIELNPSIEFKDSFKISDEEMKQMKERSHRYCFIANSLSDEVAIIIN